MISVVFSLLLKLRAETSKATHPHSLRERTWALGHLVWPTWACNLQVVWPGFLPLEFMAWMRQGRGRSPQATWFLSLQQVAKASPLGHRAKGALGREAPAG